MRFQILALSGGGYLGLYTAKILSELEEAAARPLADCFDLICGTSIGGVLALGLGARVPAAEMLATFEKNGERIFSSRGRPRGALAALADLLRYATKPKYGDAPLREVISSILGDRAVGDSQHRLVIPTVNMTMGQVQLFKTPHSPGIVIDKKCKMVDVALATSAAPTYFPLAELGDSLFVDGGIVANAPDLCGLHESTHYLDQRLQDIHLLSVGTTTSQFSIPHSAGRQFGVLNWMQGGLLISTVLSAQQQFVDNLLRHQLGERYLRLDHVQSAQQQRSLALDVATPSAQKTIRGLAEATFRSVAGGTIVREFLAHAAPSPTFY